MADIKWALTKMNKGEKVTCDNGVNILFKDGEKFCREKRKNITELRISSRELSDTNWKVFKVAKNPPKTLNKKKKTASSKAA